MWHKFTFEEHLKAKTKVWDGFAINRHDIRLIAMKEVF